MATPKQTDPQFKLRLPDGMRERIRRLAEENGRSMNAQIVFMLDFAFDELDLSAKVYGDPSKAETSRVFLRDEVRRAQRILSNILADYEDPNSEVMKIVAEEESESQGKT